MGLKTCDFRYRVWECVPGNCGHVSPNAGFGGGGHIKDFGYGKPGAVFGSPHPGLWMCDSRFRVWQGCHPGNCACLTPRAVCLEVGHLEDCRRVTAGTGSVRGATPETADI